MQATNHDMEELLHTLSSQLDDYGDSREDLKATIDSIITLYEKELKAKENRAEKLRVERDRLSLERFALHSENMALQATLAEIRVQKDTLQGNMLNAISVLSASAAGRLSNREQEKIVRTNLLSADTSTITIDDEKDNSNKESPSSKETTASEDTSESPNSSLSQQRQQAASAQSAPLALVASTTTTVPPPSIQNSIPLQPPLASQLLMESSPHAKAPDYFQIINFRDNKSPDARCLTCVMCGRDCFLGKKQDSDTPTIPTQNKRVCNDCDSKVWVVQGGLHVKFCKGCKNFLLWRDFGPKHRATKCSACRKHCQEYYAAKKVQKKIKTNDWV